MWSFRRKGPRPEQGPGTAVAEPPEVFADFEGSDDELQEEIERLSASCRAERDPVLERELVRLRHIMGIRLLDAAPSDPVHPEPDYARLAGDTVLAEVSPGHLTPELLRAAILRHGCLLVRGLVDRERALALAAQIDRSFAERERGEQGEAMTEGYYEEFNHHPRFHANIGRGWVKQGGGLLASDSPMLSFEMTEMFSDAGVQRLASAYLGEPALASVQKTTLRKAEPSVGGAWHQDGSFMGPVRSLNLWLSLSRCGDDSPGLDIVPRRLDYLVPRGTDEAVFGMQVSQSKAREAAGELPILRPIFEPGDALLFDELFLHQTGSDPSMPKPRFAIESWFFSGCAFPEDYAPIAP